MNADKMMKIISGADDEFIQSALDSRNQKKERKPLRLVFRAAVAAAIIMSLAITAYATDFAGIKSLQSGGSSKIYDSYRDMKTVSKKAGFEITSKEAFNNGYTFDETEMQITDAYDEHDEKVLSYKEIFVSYKNQAGYRLALFAHPYLEEIPSSDIPATQTRQIGDVTAEYWESHYLSLPCEKEGNLTEEEKLWEQQPGNYISYFSWEGEAEERTVHYVGWTKDGISYGILDNQGAESADVLFSMAEELITQP